MIATIISTHALLRGADVEAVFTPKSPNAFKIRCLEETREQYVAFINFGDAGHTLAGYISPSCPSVSAVALNFSSR
jgi:hypothetical protein